MPERPTNFSRESSFRVEVAAARQISQSDVAVEEQVERPGAAIRHADHDIRVHDIVDKGHVLVADALDIVLAKAVAQQSWALAGLDHDDARTVLLFEVIAGRERAG